MNPSVRERWLEFSDPLEGTVPRMYADKLGLVSAGVGNLLDAVGKDGVKLPIESAWRLVKVQVLALPWLDASNDPASALEVETAWRAVRNDPKSAALGHRYSNGIRANSVHLSQPAIHELMYDKLEANDRLLAQAYANWDDAPADAQMAALSMAWALGAGFPRKFPRFSAAFRAGDYATAAGQCAIAVPLDPKTGKPIGGTIVLRNKLNRQLLLSAARADSDKAPA